MSDRSEKVIGETRYWKKNKNIILYKDSHIIKINYKKHKNYSIYFKYFNNKKKLLFEKLFSNEEWTLLISQKISDKIVYQASGW